MAVQNLLYDIQKFPWATSEVFPTNWCGFVHFWFLQCSSVWNAVAALCSCKTSRALRSDQAQYFVISLFAFAWNYLDLFLRISALHFAVFWPVLLQLYYTGMGFSHLFLLSYCSQRLWMSWIDPSEMIPVMCCPLGLIWATVFPICSYDHSQGKLELLQTPFSPLA